jgi:hypothetical protein
MLRRLVGLPERSEMPPLVDGEVISLNRPLRRSAIAATYLVILIVLSLLVYTMIYRKPVFLLFSFSCFLLAFCLVGNVFLYLRLKPRLILGDDRIQSASLVRDVEWEIKYDEIAEIKLCTKWGSPFIGINFAETSRLHPVWQCEALRRSVQRTKKWLGYDLCLSSREMIEPPAVVLEAIQRCYRRFQEDKQMQESETLN